MSTLTFVLAGWLAAALLFALLYAALRAVLRMDEDDQWPD